MRSFIQCLGVTLACAKNFELSLTLEGDFWFEHLRGVAKVNSSVRPLGAFSSDSDSDLTYLPEATYFLFLAFSPWWYNGRRAAVEFDRLATALSAVDDAVAVPHLRLMTIDCSRKSVESICARFLGLPRSPVPAWTDGIDAARIDRATYTSLSDPWPAASMPLLILGSRQEFIAKGSFWNHGIVKARLPPENPSAEAILDWLVRARPEALPGSPVLDPMPPWPVNYTYGISVPSDAIPETSNPPELVHQAFPESDVRAGLALWLHDIFARQVWELPSEDPFQRRRKALLDFLQLLCAYFPDHLEGDRLGLQNCRTSICRLGGLLQDKDFWKEHTEVIEVAVEQSTSKGRPGADPPKPSPLLNTRWRVQRIRWHKLEQRWQLCDEPWPELARRGFSSRCRSQDPLASGLPCGVWGLMHSVMAEVGLLHHCNYSRKENPDLCTGPAINHTRDELHKMQNLQRQEGQARKKEFEEEMKEEANATEPVRLTRIGSSWCLKSQGENVQLTSSPTSNDTVELRLEGMLSLEKARLTLLSFKGNTTGLPQEVELQFSDDYLHHDGGALVDRILRGPEELEELVDNYWKLREVEGSPVPGDAGSWQAMLHDSEAEKPAVWLEGPKPCGGSTQKICMQNCSRFKWLMVPKVLTENLPKEDENFTFGRLHELETGLCVGRVTAKTLFLFPHDAGLGLVDCKEGQLFRNVVAENGSESFFSEEKWFDPLPVTRPLKFSDFPFVPVEFPRYLEPLPIAPIDAVQRLRRAVELFWRCAECRQRFLSKKVPQQLDGCGASIWVWQVHNSISAELRTGGMSSTAQDFPWPGPGRHVEWPPSSLCPKCWQEGKINEQHLCRFLFKDAYASRANRSRSRTDAPGQAWEELALRFGSSNKVSSQLAALGACGLAAGLLVLNVFGSPLQNGRMQPARDGGSFLSERWQLLPQTIEESAL